MLDDVIQVFEALHLDRIVFSCVLKVPRHPIPPEIAAAFFSVDRKSRGFERGDEVLREEIFPYKKSSLRWRGHKMRIRFLNRRYEIFLMTVP